MTFASRLHASLAAFTLAAAALLPASAGAQNAEQAAALARAKAEKGAIVTDSGLVYRSIKDGAGPSPTATDTVSVHYRGTFPNGGEFDSSYKRGAPASFPLNRVIKCWTEGVQRMKVGGKARLTCPAAIAYGDRGVGDIPPGALLHFEVELLGIGGR